MLRVFGQSFRRLNLKHQSKALLQALPKSIDGTNSLKKGAPVTPMEKLMPPLSNTYQIGRPLTTSALKPTSPHSIRFHNTKDLNQYFSQADIKKWNEFLEKGTVFVHHEGHCANTLISELMNIGIKNIVLVSKQEECEFESRVSGKIVINDFNEPIQFKISSEYSALTDSPY